MTSYYRYYTGNIVGLQPIFRKMPQNLDGCMILCYTVHNTE